jgi:hypothetical protein
VVDGRAGTLRRSIIRDLEVLSAKFRAVRVDMLRAAQRLHPRDRTRAVALRKALKSFRDGDVEAKFDKGIDAIKATAVLGLADVNRALDQLQPLQERFSDVLSIVTTDRADRPALLKARCVNLIRLQENLEVGTARLSKSIEAKPENKADAGAPTAAELEALAREIEREARQLMQFTDETTPTNLSRDSLRQAAADATRVRDRLAKLDAGADTRALVKEIGVRVNRVLAEARQAVPDAGFVERDTKDGSSLMRRLEPCATNLDDQIVRISDVLSGLRPLFKSVESKDVRALNPLARAARVSEAQEAVAKAGEHVQAVQTECAETLDAAKGLKALSGLTARLAIRVSKPLNQCVDAHLPKAQKALQSFRADLENGQANAASATAAREAMHRLIDGLREAKDGLDGAPDFGELITTLSEIESAHRDIVRRLRRLSAALEEELLK